MGKDSRPVFEKYMKDASLQRCRSMCRVLREVEKELAVELLGPLLTDKRAADGWRYAVVPGQNEPRRPIRICDEAAETISLCNPDMTFKMQGEHDELDRQIDAIRKQIAAMQKQKK